MMPHTPTAKEEEKISVEEAKGRAKGRGLRHGEPHAYPFPSPSPRLAVGRGGGDGTRRRLHPIAPGVLRASAAYKKIVTTIALSYVCLCHSFLSFAALHGFRTVHSNNCRRGTTWASHGGGARVRCVLVCIEAVRVA
jgi:hypothetical protein